MTIAPMGTPLVAPGPGLAGAPGDAGAADPALGFGALVAALVADAGTGAGAGVPAQPAAGVPGALAEPAEPAGQPESGAAAAGETPTVGSADEDAESAPWCAVVPPVVPPLDLLVGRLPVPVPAPAPPGLGLATQGGVPAAGEATAVGAEVPAPATDPSPTSPPATADPTAPTTRTPDAVRRPEGAASDPTAATAATAAVHHHADAAPAVPHQADSAPSTDPGASAAVGVTGSGATAAPATERPAAPPATTAVTRQVFPEVTRLASSGPGTHHLTLRLDPGSLGEVRVTLTVRAGQVRVSLAAGQEARDALLHASPDLRRLLEQGGADATVTIRDLGAGGGTGLGGLLDRSTSRDDTAAAYARAAGEQVPSGSDRPGADHPGPQRGPGHDHHARTREDTTARDGSPDPTTPSRPVELRTSRGPSGLDVSI